jgi:hypothetical protein
MADGYNSQLRMAPIYIPAAPSTTTLAGYTATSAVSTAALQVLPSAGGFGAPSYTEGWLDFIALGSQAYIIFGDASVGAATTLCMPLPVGVYQPWFVNGARAFCRIIADGAGSVRWAPSNK